MRGTIDFDYFELPRVRTGNLFPELLSPSVIALFPRELVVVTVYYKDIGVGVVEEVVQSSCVGPTAESGEPSPRTKGVGQEDV